VTTIFARRARLPEGWASDLSVTIVDGKIAALSPESTPTADAVRVDTLLPALANVHSHSFQRAMAGMTEYRSANHDSFWTWRELMYRFANRITPDQLEAIAALTFMEMQEAGYASVGEFHYLHHQKGGAPYDAIDELSQRIFAAAALTGIGLTHLPVLYSYGAAGKKPLAAEQLRFGNDVDRYCRLVEAAASTIASAGADARVGIAPHSLRATSPENLASITSRYKDCPVHIHIAEQPQEVSDVKNWLGAPPVRWLLDHAPVDGRWQLVHATHMIDEETTALAASGAVAGLCPITEANLGDGVFNGAVFLAAGGAFGIGSDSNVRISMTEELRMLEYSQRLTKLSRSVLAGESGSVGETLYLGAATGGAQALGRDAGAIEIGKLADLVAIDSAAPSLSILTDKQLLDGLCFSASDSVVTDLWSAGRHTVSSGRHRARDAIVARYKASATALASGL
jgi:formiminoglutamate deiminase